MKKILFLIFLTTLVCRVSGCTFEFIPFCNQMWTTPDDMIVFGKISNIDDDGIDLEIIDILRGEEDRLTIRIWDGTDFDCNGFFSMAAELMGEVGDSIVVILPEITSVENTWDVLGDYRRPFPYHHGSQLEYRSGHVFGNLSWSISKWSYSSFKEQILNFESCENIVSNSELSGQQKFVISNPIESELVIKTFDVRFSRIVLISLNGRLLVDDKVIGLDYFKNIGHLPNGLYWLVIYQDNNPILRKKIVKI